MPSAPFARGAPSPSQPGRTCRGPGGTEAGTVCVEEHESSTRETFLECSSVPRFSRWTVPQKTFESRQPHVGRHRVVLCCWPLASPAAPTPGPRHSPCPRTPCSRCPRHALRGLPTALSRRQHLRLGSAQPRPQLQHLLALQGAGRVVSATPILSITAKRPVSAGMRCHGLGGKAARDHQGSRGVRLARHHTTIAHPVPRARRLPLVVVPRRP